MHAPGKAFTNACPHGGGPFPPQLRRNGRPFARNGQTPTSTYCSKMRLNRISLACCLAAVFSVAVAGLQSQEISRPNILFFITDDETWMERSAYGWSKLPTPAFDRVAEQGALFTNGFTSAPSCAPSRASVLTGRNFWELKQGAFIQGYLPREFPIFTHLLAERGYHIGKTGKGWGPGVFIDASHDHLTGPTYNEIKVVDPLPAISPIDYSANFKRFLQDRKPGQPFFFWAGVTEPHAAFDSENYVRLEKEFGLLLDQVPVHPFLEDSRDERISRANILYEICYADLHLERMLAHLEAVGERGNTLIVVTSDNGTSVSDANGVHGKASPYDSGVHIPLAAMWPSRVAPGRTVTDFVNFRDLAPTFLEIAGITPPASMTGKSLLPLLLSKNSGRIDAGRNWMMTGLEWHGEFDPESRSTRSLRNDRYSYIVRYKNVDNFGNPLSSPELIDPYAKEFYDLTNDPWEQKNLIDDPRYAGDIEKLAEQMRSYGLATRDPRSTGELDIFIQTRRYVQMRKKMGYENTLNLPFDRAANGSR